MKYRRCQHSVKLIGSKIYVIGGYTLPDKEPIMEIEFYSINERQPQWVEYSYMMIPPLYGFAGVEVDDYKFVILGGMNDKHNPKRYIYHFNFGYIEDERDEDPYCKRSEDKMLEGKY